jgi:serine/threonine protein kinase
MFVAMEWIEGKTCDVIAGGEGLPVDEVVNLLQQAARTLGCAHQAGVVHREVYPGHLMVDAKGSVRVLGWTQALRIGDDSLAAFEKPGTAVGDTDYAAPEACEDSRRVDIRADIYGLGCTLFSLLTGRVLFPESDPQERINKHRFQSPPLLREARSDVPLALEQLYLQMVAKAPEGRPADMSQVISRLDAIG